MLAFAERRQQLFPLAGDPPGVSHRAQRRSPVLGGVDHPRLEAERHPGSGGQSHIRWRNSAIRPHNWRRGRSHVRQLWFPDLADGRCLDPRRKPCLSGGIPSLARAPATQIGGAGHRRTGLIARRPNSRPPLLCDRRSRHASRLVRPFHLLTSRTDRTLRRGNGSVAPGAREIRPASAPRLAPARGRFSRARRGSPGTARTQSRIRSGQRDDRPPSPARAATRRRSRHPAARRRCSATASPSGRPRDQSGAVAGRTDDRVAPLPAGRFSVSHPAFAQ